MTAKSLTQSLLFAASLLLPSLAHADSVVLSSQSGSTSVYSVYAPDGTLSYDAGDTVTLSGLSGITGVTLSDTAGYFGTVSWTDSTITYTTNQSGSLNQSGPVDMELFTVTTNGSSTGDLSYAMQESDGTYTGVVQTDVAATPEPSTLLLLGTGALGIGLFARRRRSAEADGAAADASIAHPVFA